MGRPSTPKRGYRTMKPDDIFKLNVHECSRGINSCRTAHSVAKKYGDQDTMDAMDLQIGAFTIQIDMLMSGDIGGTSDACTNVPTL